MKRRALLATGAAVAIAGCSSSESDEADISPVDATLETDSVIAGESVEIDVKLENDGSGAGEFELELLTDSDTLAEESVTVDADATESVTLEWTFDEADEYALAVNDMDAGTISVYLSEDDYAEQLIAEAEDHLGSAVNRLDGLSMTSDTIGDDLNDDFEAMEEAIDEARELQLTDAQMWIIKRMEHVVLLIEDLADAHAKVADLTGVAEDAVDNFAAGDTTEIPNSDTESARDALSDALWQAKVFESSTNLDRLDVVEEGDIVGVVEPMEEDIEDLESFSDALDAIRDWNIMFWAWYDRFHDGHNGDYFHQDLLQKGRKSISDGESIGVDISDIDTYSLAMSNAAEHYYDASAEREAGDDPSVSIEAGEEYLDEAEEVGFSNLFDQLDTRS